MAAIYHTMTVNLDSKRVQIRQLDEEEYHVAITFPDTDEEDQITEVCLTREEVKEAYDLLFNR